MRQRQIAPVALVLALAVAGFIVARVLADRDARSDSEHRAEVAAAQIHGRIAQAASLTESLRRFMLDASGTGVQSDQFANNAFRWLNPAGFPAAAWVERISDSGRPAYERRIGQPIVTPDASRRILPRGSRPSYLPATLVSGFDPMSVPGTDLSGATGLATALTRATRVDGVAATPLAPPGGVLSGLFVVAPAPNLIGAALRPGYVVVFVPDVTLRAAATDTPTVQITAAGTSTAARQSARAAGSSFTEAGQRFRVLVPEESVGGPAAVLPWLILAAGLALAALAGALGVNSARRAKAQADLDRIFNLSPDLIAVADFEGHFTRVNPAVEQVLGYTEEEFLARPYLEFVHPDDRERTSAQASAIACGEPTLSFETRYVRKDGPSRVLEWTATPVVEDGLMYGVARDVTERRHAEAEVERLADEQAALRRVATLVAQGVPSAQLFNAVSGEVGRLFGSDMAAVARFDADGPANVVVGITTSLEGIAVGSRWELVEGMAATEVYRTGRSARSDVDWASGDARIAAPARRLGLASSVSSPIVVESRLWGTISVAGTEPLPPQTEERLEKFTELVATAISNAESREALARLAEEQAALRRLATLVARQPSEAEVFTAVAAEIQRLLAVDEIRMLRYEHDGTAAVVAGSGACEDVVPIGLRIPLGREDPATRVFRTGRPARIDNDRRARGPIVEAVGPSGLRSVVAAPIVVDDRGWGAIVVGTMGEEPLPPDTESRLGQFTELMATAIANAESHARADRLAAEQAALRRVATLVAKESSPADAFAKVAEEAANTLGNVDCALWRDEGDGTVRAVAVWGSSVSAGIRPGTRVAVDALSLIAQVLREGRPCRIDDYSAATGPIAERAREMGLRSAVGCPIVVRGRTWGVMAVARYDDEAFPAETDARTAQFSELVATAIANAEARSEVARLAEEQAALRRVATLVAEGMPATAVFDAVAAEMQRLLGADGVTLSRYGSDEEVIVVAHRGSDPRTVPPGTRVSHRGENVTSLVRRSERSARMEHHQGTQGAIAELVRSSAVRVSVGAPIVVEGRLWGVALANWRGEEPPPADTEERMAQFAELLDTAIANADSRDQLRASRARLLTAADEARRRVVRDLHDGAQQRLVHTVVSLKLARQALRQNDERAETLVDEALEHAQQGNTELRELAHGILPAVLTRGGLRAGVRSLAGRLDLLVEIDVPPDRLPAEIEASAYFIVAEALTNVVKHAHAERAQVKASVEDGMLSLEVRDDGIGGADPDGHGLVGMDDRVTALGGRLEIESQAGGGTLVAATLPLSERPSPQPAARP